MNGITEAHLFVRPPYNVRFGYFIHSPIVLIRQIESDTIKYGLLQEMRIKDMFTSNEIFGNSVSNPPLTSARDEPLYCHRPVVKITPRLFVPVKRERSHSDQHKNVTWASVQSLPYSHGENFCPKLFSQRTAKSVI